MNTVQICPIIGLARGLTLPFDFLGAGNVVVMTGIGYVVTMRAR